MRGKKWRLLERAAVAAVFRGSQAQLGQKLRGTLRGDNDGRITRLLERLEKRGVGGLVTFQDIYEGPGDDDWGTGV